jgi:hypothetical protein
LIPLPAGKGRAAGYLLLADRTARAPAELGRLIEEQLRSSPRYGQAREMGQLEALSVCVRADARAVVEAHQLAAGKVWGAVKPTPLLLDPIEGGRLAQRLAR